MNMSLGKRDGTARRNNMEIHDDKRYKVCMCEGKEKEDIDVNLRKEQAIEECLYLRRDGMPAHIFVQ